jgi:hypothetical protein
MADIRRAKALKLLEALCEDHENVKTDGDHNWHRCRACLAREELDHKGAVGLLRLLLNELRATPPEDHQP